jgi:hypothetical protein
MLSAVFLSMIEDMSSGPEEDLLGIAFKTLATS